MSQDARSAATSCDTLTALASRSAEGGGVSMNDPAIVEWERFDYEHGETIWQRECPDCDRGLLLAPARFCPRCDGSGYLTTTADPTRAES